MSAQTLSNTDTWSSLVDGTSCAATRGFSPGPYIEPAFIDGTSLASVRAQSPAVVAALRAAEVGSGTASVPGLDVAAVIERAIAAAMASSRLSSPSPPPVAAATTAHSCTHCQEYRRTSHLLILLLCAFITGLALGALLLPRRRLAPSYM